MKLVLRLIGLGIAFVILLQSVQFAVVSYFYTNHNAVLVAACCKNKATDTSCKAKCFLDESKKQDQNNKSLSLKKAEYTAHNSVYFLPQITTCSFSKEDLIVKSYSNLYSFLYTSQEIHPPSFC